MRPGIVHRLDRDTSGAILVARTDRAHHKLALQFQNRMIEKEYFAIVAGKPDRDRDFIDRAIGVHPQQREKMAIRRDDPASRSAQTFYEVGERFDGFAVVRVFPKTGRTHQIRVHLSHIGCPVLCDRQYGGRAQDHAGRNPPRSAGRVRVAGSPGPARPAAPFPASCQRRADGDRGPVARRHDQRVERIAAIPGVKSARAEHQAHQVAHAQNAWTGQDLAGREARGRPLLPGEDANEIEPLGLLRRELALVAGDRRHLLLQRLAYVHDETPGMPPRSWRCARKQ